MKQIIDAAPDGSTVIIGYGGAVGGGKTFLEAGFAAELALDIPGSETLVGRQDFVDLKDTTLKQFDRMTRELPHRRKYDSAPTWRELRRSADRDWGRVTFRGLEDWESLMSAEYGAIAIEEAHEVPLEAVLGLLSRLRHPAARVYVLLVCFNPLGGWPERWFMKGELPAEVQELPSLQIHFVPAKMTDNPHLRPGYEAMLRAMYPEHMVTKLIEGQPGGVENAVYPHFTPETHVWPLPNNPVWVDGAIGVDRGRIHKSALVTVKRSITGRLWVVDAWGHIQHDRQLVDRDILAENARVMRQFQVYRGNTDPLQENLANNLGYEFASSEGEGPRQRRIMAVSRLMGAMQGNSMQKLFGAVPAHLVWEQLDMTESGRTDADGLPAGAPGIVIAEGARGVVELCEEIRAYHLIHKLSETEDKYVVHRANDDLIAAMEYAVELLESDPRIVMPGQAARGGRVMR